MPYLASDRYVDEVGMDKIRRLALARAAHQFIALDGENPGDALAVYDQLKALGAEYADTPLDQIDDDVIELGGVYEGDLSQTLAELISDIEHLADEMVSVTKEVLKAAHEGLIEAAIDGTLDSDANTWHLPSLAEQFVSIPEPSLLDAGSDFTPSM